MTIKKATLSGMVYLAMIILSPFRLAAQNNTEVTLTIEQAIDFAIKNHPQIKNADLDIAIAHEKLSELIAIGLPQINFSADMNKFIEIPTQFVPEIGRAHV